MVKQKAPKDMTAVEFVEYLIARKKDEKVLDVNVYYTLEFLRGRLNEPAPNPFTEDQLAVMREYQRNGINFAVNNNRVLLFYADEPKLEDHVWRSKKEPLFTISPELSFLGKELAILDIICFADYAPLEEK